MNQELSEREKLLKRMQSNMKMPANRATTPTQVEAQTAVRNYFPIDDLVALHGSYDIYNVPLTSRRPIIGPLFVLTKRVLRRLLLPFFLRQLTFNASAARIFSFIKDALISLKQSLHSIEQQVAQVRAQSQALERRQEQLQKLVVDLNLEKEAKLERLQKQFLEAGQKQEGLRKQLQEAGRVHEQLNLDKEAKLEQLQKRFLEAGQKQEGLQKQLQEAGRGQEQLQKLVVDMNLEKEGKLERLQKQFLEAGQKQEGLQKQLLEAGRVQEQLQKLVFEMEKELARSRSAMDAVGTTIDTVGNVLGIHGQVTKEDHRFLGPSSSVACLDREFQEKGNWLRPTILGPSTVGQYALGPESRKQVISILKKLDQDAVMQYLLKYYQTGQTRYGDGWRYADLTTALVALATLLRPKRYLEIGVFHGRSMCMVGALCPEAELVGFDMWVEGYAGLSNPGPKLVRQQLKKVRHRGPVTLISGNSHETVPRYFCENPDAFDLITVDGDHTAEGGRQDLRDVLPHLAVGGFVLLDDISYPGSEFLYKIWAQEVMSDPRFVCWDFRELGNGIAIALKQGE
ncbi:MAG TPA: class I SAM-dependent methyltransferase [Terriglobales bacterium]|jgi:predicted O-methyltransferase YrrM|nr:class I SAM-dependent methyltransferase [Terriglobales bacterium]